MRTTHHVFAALSLALALLATQGSSTVCAAILVGGEPDPTFDSNSMLLWLRGDMGFTAGANTDWVDQSTNGFTFRQTVAASQPTQNLAGLNSQATIDFDGGDHLAKLSGSLTGYQTTFIVYNDTSTASWVSPIGSVFNPAGGNGSSYHGQSSDGGIFNVGNTDNKTLNGANFRNGAGIGNGASTPRPDSYAIDAHVATGPLTGDVLFVGSAECCGSPPASRKIVGGIAEILMYNQALSATEINAVGNYLEGRYGITWTDLAVAPAGQLDLADVIGGGDGKSLPLGLAGINKLSGAQVTIHDAAVIRTGAGFQAVAGNALVDGINVPDGGSGGGPVQYNTLGGTIVLPDTTNQTWDHAITSPRTRVFRRSAVSITTTPQGIP